MKGTQKEQCEMVKTTIYESSTLTFTPLIRPSLDISPVKKKSDGGECLFVDHWARMDVRPPSFFFKAIFTCDESLPSFPYSLSPTSLRLEKIFVLMETFNSGLFKK